MAQSIPSVPIPRAFVGHLSFTIFSGCEDLTENLCPGVELLSILLEAVYVVPFSIFRLKKICLVR